MNRFSPNRAPRNDLHTTTNRDYSDRGSFRAKDLSTYNAGYEGRAASSHSRGKGCLRGFPRRFSAPTILREGDTKRNREYVGRGYSLCLCIEDNGVNVTCSRNIPSLLV